MSGNHRLPFISSDKIIYAMDGVFKYMLHCILELQGRMDESLLARAIEHALAKSPILKSVARLKSFGSYWKVIEGETPCAMLTVKDLSHETDADATVAALLQSYVNETIDITQSPPTRFLLLRLPDERSVFVMKVHHCAVDPAGMMNCLDDIQTAYGHLLKDEPLPAIIPMASRSRQRLMWHISPMMWLRVLWRAALKAARFQESKPRGFIQFDNGHPTTTIAYRIVDFKGRDYTTFRARCKSFGVTANELVMAALCRAMRRWNGDREQPENMYSIIMPVDLRWYIREGGRVPRIMANFIGGSWISVPVAEVTSAEATIRYVARETRYIKDHHIGLLANLGLPLLNMFSPRWLRQTAQRVYQQRPQQMVPTAVFAYLGKIERIMSTFPGCQLTRISGVGAGFDPVGLDVVVVNFDHVFSITVTYLKDACPDAQMDQFMTIFADEVLGRTDE